MNGHDQLLYLAVVRFLLSHGIGVNRRRSETALDAAIECEREDIADLLRSRGGVRAAELDSGSQ